MVGTQGVSTHLPPAKDRSLASTLLRISERKGLLDDFFVESVIYCGPQEPFNGWTNAAPTARYSEANRPKVEFPKKKRQNRKAKQLDAKDSMSDVYNEFMGMTSRADGHYHASAALHELYDEYKKRQRLDDFTKLKGMIDPVTFRYVPIDQRHEEFDSDDGSGVRLPVLKMTHANKQAKLLEVLENFMNRHPEDGKRTDTEKYAVKGIDAASFYDKYRWYFKDKQGKLPRHTKITKRGKRYGKRRAEDDPRSYYSEDESEESGGRRRRRRHSHPPTYVIQVKDEKSKTLTEETITFERKTDYGLSAPGGPGIDRWVARVVIRDKSKEDSQSYSPATASQVTSKSEHEQLTKLHEIRTKNVNNTKNAASKQPDYRLSNKKNKKRNGRKLPSSFYDLYHLSAVETAKVSMKYNVPVGKRQTDGNESSSLEGVTSKETPRKKKIVKPAPIHSQKHIDSVNQLAPNAKKVVPLIKKPDGIEKVQDGRSLPLPPINSKRTPNSSENANAKTPRLRKKLKPAETEKKGSKGEGALVSTHKPVESSEERQVKTPSSSTFNPDRMFQQMKDTADFITKASMLSKANKSIHSSPRFLSHIEDARSADGSRDGRTEGPSRKPLHPKHNKNRAQDKLQQIIDEEKELVSQVIKQMNCNWKESKSCGDQTTTFPESIQDALSTAIAKARLHDAQGSGTVSTARRSSVNQVMKRRGVPPLREKSSVPTTTVGSEENFFINDSTAFLTTKPKLPSMRSNGSSKKPEAKVATLPKSIKSLSRDRNESFKANNKLQPGVRFVPDGDFLITKSQSIAPMVPGIFEASISSVKPTRRIANVNQPFDIRQRA